MPVPRPIQEMHQAAHLCGNYALAFNNPNAQGGPRGQITRNFHVYLEVGPQSKHCALMRGYCQQIQVVGRPEQDSQIDHARGATAQTVLGPGGFYHARGQTAAGLAKDKMVEMWRQPQLPGTAVFKDHTTGNGGNRYHRVDVGGQNIRRGDGYCYESSFWYEGNDIYVLFHCYPPRQ